jgi:hypothetical protein
VAVFISPLSGVRDREAHVLWVGWETTEKVVLLRRDHTSLLEVLEAAEELLGRSFGSISLRLVEVTLTAAEGVADAGGVERNATRALLDGTRLMVGVEGTRGRGNAGAEVLN